MHQPVGDDDAPPEGLPDRLMPEAHAENGDGAREAHHGAEADARLVRRARTGRDHDALGIEAGDTAHIVGVVQHDLAGGPQGLQILDEVVGKRVVIVDDYDARHEVAKEDVRDLAPGSNVDIAEGISLTCLSPKETPWLAKIESRRSI